MSDAVEFDLRRRIVALEAELQFVRKEREYLLERHVMEPFLTEKDRDHLRWIYDRLVSVHGENQNADYMQKLASIVGGRGA